MNVTASLDPNFVGAVLRPGRKKRKGGNTGEVDKRDGTMRGEHECEKGGVWGKRRESSPSDFELCLCRWLSNRMTGC